MLATPRQNKQFRFNGEARLITGCHQDNAIVSEAIGQLPDCCLELIRLFSRNSESGNAQVNQVESPEQAGVV